MRDLPRMYTKYRNEKKMDIPKLLKQILQKENEREDKFLSEEDLDELLSEENQDENPRESIFGYPTRPLYRDLGTILTHWMNTGHCPVLDLPTYDLLDEKSYTDARKETFKQITPLLEGLKSLQELWTDEEKRHRIRDVLVLLGRRGMLDLLGLRKTVGSFDYWPPPRKVLENTFCTKHKLPSELTVGARALAKHGHRDQSTSWWGVSTGSEAAKNGHALGIMNKVLDDAHWINIHQLPHDVRIIEVRQQNGYGVRWTNDGMSFRGFLEPQMVDGHEVGWRH